MRSETVHRVFYVHYLLIICQSEPHYQHQNFTECHYQTVKRLINTIIDRKSPPKYKWLISLIYVWFLLNRTHATGINITPITKATASTSDISPLLCFVFGYQSITSQMTLVYHHIVLENMINGLVLPNMLDVIWPSRYSPMTPKR